MFFYINNNTDINRVKTQSTTNFTLLKEKDESIKQSTV